MKPFILFILLLSVDCGDAGIRDEDRRKAARPLPTPGDRVMVPERNDPGVLRHRDGIPSVVFSDGTSVNAAERQVVILPAGK